MTEKPLLKLFFEYLGADVDQVPWDKLKRNDINAIQNLFDKLPSDKRDAAEVVLREVHTLACEQGIQALGEAAEELHADQSWGDIYLSDKNLYAKALSAWLLFREIFDHAARYYELDTLSWWRKRLDLPKKIPVFDETVKKNLETEIEEFFKTRQGRGFICTVEMYARSDGTFYFFAYPADYVEDTYVHDESGNLVAQMIRKTFEIVFVYDSIEGTSDLSAKLSPKIKDELETIFLRQILDFVPENYKKDLYDLSPLMTSSFQMRVRPEDRLKVQVVSFTLFWDKKAVLAVVPKGSLTAEDIIKHGINVAQLSMEKAIVQKARFRFEFLPSGKGRSKVITFDIGTPDSCTLKNQDPTRLEKIHHYLKEWRIEYDNKNETTINAS
jgi:hypothetical protein